MIQEITATDGYVKVSEGALQYQILEVSGTVGILHADSAPEASVPCDFTERAPEIKFSLGNSPCYIKLVRGDVLKISTQDIS